MISKILNYLGIKIEYDVPKEQKSLPSQESLDMSSAHSKCFCEHCLPTKGGRIGEVESEQIHKAFAKWMGTYKLNATQKMFAYTLRQATIQGHKCSLADFEKQPFSGIALCGLKVLFTKEMLHELIELNNSFSSES